jgi:hypothetical protein
MRSKIFAAAVVWFVLAANAWAANLTANNVAGLYTARPGNGDIVSTLGYTTDGIGSNRYRYVRTSSATVNGVTVMDGPGGNGTGTGRGRYLAIDQKVIDVTQAGAIGDGVADDTAEIQSAITVASSLGLPVSMPPGTYIISDTLDVPAGAVRFQMFGAGRSATIINCNALVNVPAIDVSDTTFCHLRDFGMVGDSSSGHAIHGVDPNWLTGAFLPQHLQIEKVYITGFTGSQAMTGVPGGATIPACGIMIAGGLEVHVLDCLISSCDIGVYSFASFQTKVSRAVVSSCASAGIIDQNTEASSYEACDILAASTTLGDTVTLLAPSSRRASATMPSAGFIVTGSRGCVLERSKLKNSRVNIVTESDFSPLIANNWIRADVKLGILNYGPCREEGNTFHPAYIPPHDFTVNSGTSTVKLTSTAHGFVDGEEIFLWSSDTLPTGLAQHAIYFVKSATANDFEVSLTSGGASVTFSTNGTGTHTAAIARRHIYYDMPDGTAATIGSVTNNRFDIDGGGGTFAMIQLKTANVFYPIDGLIEGNYFGGPSAQANPTRVAYNVFSDTRVRNLTIRNSVTHVPPNVTYGYRWSFAGNGTAAPGPIIEHNAEQNLGGTLLFTEYNGPYIGTIYVNVKDYGAFGNGSADDTAAVQAAIDAANGVPVYFPAGQYMVQGLTVSDNHQTLIGDGGYKSMLTKRANGVIMTISSAQKPVLTGICFNGNAGNGFTGDNLEITSSEAELNQCISYASAGRALFAHGAGVKGVAINGGLWNTVAAAGQPVIQLGLTGEGDYYYSPVIDKIYVQDAGNDNTILLVDTAASVISNSSIAAITITQDGATTGCKVIGNRIAGDIAVEGPYHNFFGNELTQPTAVNFLAASSNCRWSGNTEAVGHSVTNAGEATNHIERSAAVANGTVVRYGADANATIVAIGITGNPNGVLTAPSGSLALRSDGGAGTSAYIKESDTSNQDWTAIAPGGGGGLPSGGNVGDLIINDAPGSGVWASSLANLTLNSGGILSFTDATVRAGTGSPEGVVTATVGSLYSQTDGVAGMQLWTKESGTGDTGWVQVGDGAEEPSFGTISFTNGQADVVADQVDDTVTLIEGTGIDFASNAAGDQITVSATATGGDGTFSTLTANSATPSVTDLRLVRTANTAGTAYTNFTGGVEGQLLEIHVTDVNTSFVDNANLSLLGDANIPVSSAPYRIAFRHDGTAWRQLFLAPEGHQFSTSASGTDLTMSNSVTDSDIEISVDGTAALLTLDVDGTNRLTASNTGIDITGILSFGATTTTRAGTGSPEGAVTATIGSLYYQTDAVAGSQLWTKETDNGLNTGWTQVGTSTQEPSFGTLSFTNGQADVVADVVDDAATFVEGTGITLASNAATDQITINSFVTDGDKGDLTITAGVWELDNPESFGTISFTNGQADVIADAHDDQVTFIQGTGITLTSNAATDQITISATAAGNSFETIASTGQASVVAESGTDTLNLEVGEEMNVVTNATTDSITISLDNPEWFTAIDVATQASVNADQDGDNLTLAAGTGISITTNATTDTITITNTGATGGDGTFTTLTADSATPTVTSLRLVDTANTVATAYTNFVGGTEGQMLEVHVNDANSSFTNNANLSLIGGVNIPASSDPFIIKFRHDGTQWKQYSYASTAHQLATSVDGSDNITVSNTTTDSDVDFTVSGTAGVIRFDVAGTDRLLVDNTGVDVVGVLDLGGAELRTGTGSPEGVVTGDSGDIFIRTDGGAGTSAYIKEDDADNTTWTAFAFGGGGGLPNGGVQYDFLTKDSATNGDATWKSSVHHLNVATGTLTSSTPGVAISQTWNASGTTFVGLDLSVTDTASAAASRLFQIRDATTGVYFFVDKAAMAQASNMRALNNGGSTTPAFQIGNTSNGFYSASSRIGVKVDGTAGTLMVGNVLSEFASPLQFQRSVEANTAGSGAPNVLTAIESSKVLTNQGSTAANYHTLPSAVAGYTYTFIVQDTDGLRITASAGDTIGINSNVTAAAGYVESTQSGNTITLTAINATEWVAGEWSGIWTDGTFTTANTDRHPIGLLTVNAGETSINVTGKSHINMANASATTIGTISTSEAQGQIITFSSSNGNTTIDNNTSIKCMGGVDLLLGTNDGATFSFNGSAWIQTGYSDN